MATDDQNQIRLKLNKGSIPGLGFGTYAPGEVMIVYNVIEWKKSKLIWAVDRGFLCRDDDLFTEFDIPYAQGLPII